MPRRETTGINQLTVPISPTRRLRSVSKKDVSVVERLRDMVDGVLLIVLTRVASHLLWCRPRHIAGRLETLSGGPNK